MRSSSESSPSRSSGSSQLNAASLTLGGEGCSRSSAACVMAIPPGIGFPLSWTRSIGRCKRLGCPRKAGLLDRLTRLEISQDREAGRRGEEMLERVPAQDEMRVDCVVGELEQLGERIKHRGNDPVEGAGIFRRAEHQQQRQGETWKELDPAVEAQITGKAPQHQTEHARCHERPKQHGTQSCADALLDDESEDRGKAERHRQPVPQQRTVAWLPVIIRGAKAGQKYPEEDHEGCRVAMKPPH